jgi:hypothetical protein
MLDNLVNPNLAGLTGNIQYYYDSSSAVIPQVIIATVLIFCIGLIAAIIGICSESKTRRYRKELVDMYIAGTVKSLAKKEGIDLDEEYKDFRRREKKKYLEEKPLDKVIEIEKAEQYIDEQEKKLKK